MSFDNIILDWGQPALLWGLFSAIFPLFFYHKATGHKRIFRLPSLHLVKNLQDDFPQTSHLRLWHLLIRVAMIALFVCLCAAPSLRINQAGHAATNLSSDPTFPFDWDHIAAQYPTTPPPKTILIMPVLGGFSAHDWPKAKQILTRFLNQPDSRAKQYLFPAQMSPRILSATDLITEIETFSPTAWMADWAQATRQLNLISQQPDLIITLTSTHLFRGSQSSYESYLQRLKKKWPNHPHLFWEVSTTAQPVLLWQNTAPNSAEQIWQLSGPITDQHQIHFYSRHGTLLGHMRLQAQQNSFSLSAQPIPLSDIAHLSLKGPGTDHAAARYILAPPPQTPLTYIVRPDHLAKHRQAESETLLHLLEDESHYWQAAFRNHARLKAIQADELLSEQQKRPDLLILPSYLLLNPAIRKSLTKWISLGSLIVTTANHRASATIMPANGDIMVQLALAPKRFFSGQMSGVQAPKSITFMPDTPLDLLQNMHHLTSPDSQNLAPLWQALPPHSSTQQSQIWARFEDGSPFLSFFPGPQQPTSPMAGGILFAHISADPQQSRWSLSPLFPKIAQAIARAMRHVSAADQSDFAFPLHQEISATGDILAKTSPQSHLSLPPFFNLALLNPDEQKIFDIFTLKPGLYGLQDYWYSLMAGDVLHQRFPEIKTHETLFHKRPAHTDPAYHLSALSSQKHWPITELLIILLGVLLLLDFTFSLNWQKRLSRNMVLPVCLMIFITFGTTQLQAQDRTGDQDQQQLVEALSQMRLGYLVTDQMTVLQRQQTEEGLLFLTYLLNQKTALELAPPHAVDPGQNILSPYPFLYWPIYQSTFPSLSARAYQSLQHYLQNDGMLFMDWVAALSQPTQPITDFLQGFLQKTAQPSLRPLSEKHVLQHSFYLLNDPGDGNFWGGLYPSPELWFSPYPNQSEQDLTSLIVGQNNWGQAWSLQWSQTLARQIQPTQPTADQAYETFLNQQVFAQFAPGNRDNLYQEQSNRFGVNLIIFSLMGLYKADQVHIPTLLKREHTEAPATDYLKSPQPVPLLPRQASPPPAQNRPHP